MNLRIQTILLGTLAGFTFSTSSLANVELAPTHTDITLNIIVELEQNLQSMLTEIPAPHIQAEVVKQLKLSFLEQQTNQLVKNASDELPEYKFRVVLTD